MRSELLSDLEDDKFLLLCCFAKADFRLQQEDLDAQDEIIFSDSADKTQTDMRVRKQ